MAIIRRIDTDGDACLDFGEFTEFFKINTPISYKIHHNGFTPATACSASSSTQVEAGGRGSSMAGSTRTEAQYYTQLKEY